MEMSIVEAARLNRANRAEEQRLRARHEDLVGRLGIERDAHDLRRTNIYYTAIAPFCEVFATLKNVELGALTEIHLPPATDLPLREDAPAATIRGVHGLAAAAGGAAVGAGAGSAAFAGVGAFAAASTGTPIASLSGAAATNATLAWLGGGSLAAGGGGVAVGSLVLTGVVAAPVLIAGTGFVVWKGRRDLRDQRAVAVQLAEQEAVMSREEQRCDAVLRRSRLLRTALADLQDHIARRIGAFTALVDRTPDFAVYTPEERDLVRTLVRLVSTATTLMGTRPADESGAVTTESGLVIEQARALLADLDRADTDRAAGTSRTESAA
ncbi:hypothetical protein Ae168Ps1_5302c [Pseudonocardia sp. Ae168_Ps1]|nr:hypothetical protein Ae150APs1_5260c [Pseudonocardia sp. Ae150A_Ps1]OLL82896.1 hypothetical protein Ae168Ps1_5302c [Pseudonocardia sp. Ae168_Ps1]OLL82992.1 hypothetical protein Ae263Ps1_0047 [Pseudonocardia sp. Ae263_Ps1]OLL90970.1 hypothetical protein Ae356Ps1_0867c [Pseudonocardia sp. Ae356_Ps1]